MTDLMDDGGTSARPNSMLPIHESCLVAARTAVLLTLLLGADARAQLPGDNWILEDGYGTNLLYVHALVNYAYDLEWQYEWERRQFAENSLRINTGSVSSDQLLTDVDLNVNQPLNDQWRFFGRFDRKGFRRRPESDDLLLLGFERSVFESSGVYVAVNPEFGKEFLDVGAGFTVYRKNREQYLRLGLLVEDMNWGSKNQQGGSQEQRPMKVEWTLRWALPSEWWVYSEGRMGQGFERTLPDPVESPELITHDRRDDRIELRVSRGGERYWAAMLEWYDFEETKTFRTPGFDYDYANTQLNVGVEHVRVVADKHRWRFLIQYVDQQAESIGFRQHDFNREEVLGGIFYERLRPQSAWSIAYAFGSPDMVYEALETDNSFMKGEYTDKLIAGWRYRFSQQAQVRVTIAHEVSDEGFGGGAVQYQMFF